jgi:hypothetical protein
MLPDHFELKRGALEDGFLAVGALAPVFVASRDVLD